MFDLYLITDPDAPGGVVELTRRAIEAAPAGRVAVQLRAKDRAPEERERLGRELREVTASHGVPLLVNGDPSLATRLGADGVHLPERSMTVAEARSIAGDRALVGVSCHDVEGVRVAAAGLASFAVLGPFAPTPSKGAALGAPAFARVVARCPRFPIFALGGIDASNAGSAVRAGATGVAVIRAVYRAKDPAEAVGALLASLDTARAGER